MLLRAVLNGLAVSYHCRLPTRKLRNAYRQLIARILADHRVQMPQMGNWQGRWDDEAVVNHLLKSEMREYLKHMRLPEMTAVNEALLENVFVRISVSILGCSAWFLPCACVPFLPGHPARLTLAEGLLLQIARGGSYPSSCSQNQVCSVAFGAVALPTRMPRPQICFWHGAPLWGRSAPVGHA